MHVHRGGSLSRCGDSVWLRHTACILVTASIVVASRYSIVISGWNLKGVSQEHFVIVNLGLLHQP
jgi:hypothetical protein